MSKDSTQRPRPDSNRGPFDPKSDAVTDWPLRLLPDPKSDAVTDWPLRPLFRLAPPERAPWARTCDPSVSSSKRKFKKNFENSPFALQKRSKQSSANRSNTASPESFSLKLVTMPRWQILQKEHTTQQPSSSFPPLLTMYTATVDCSTPIWRRNRACARWNQFFFVQNFV